MIAPKFATPEELAAWLRSLGFKATVRYGVVEVAARES